MSIQAMLSAHHLCIFVSDLHRQLNEAPFKADKSRHHDPLRRFNKSSFEGCNHAKDYFWGCARLIRNKLGPLFNPQVFFNGFGPVMKSWDSKQRVQDYWFKSEKCPVGGRQVLYVE